MNKKIDPLITPSREKKKKKFMSISGISGQKIDLPITPCRKRKKIDPLITLITPSRKKREKKIVSISGEKTIKQHQ